MELVLPPSKSTPPPYRPEEQKKRVPVPNPAKPPVSGRDVPSNVSVGRDAQLCVSGANCTFNAAPPAPPPPEPAPIKFDGYLGPGHYGAETSVGGLKWNNIYSDARLYLVNPTTVTYSDLDAWIKTDQSIANVGFIGLGAEACKATSVDPSGATITLEGKGAKGEPLNLPPITMEMAGGMSPVYHIHCEKLYPSARLELVVAVIGNKPVVNGVWPNDPWIEKTPNWIAAEVGFVAFGQQQSTGYIKCFLKPACQVPNPLRLHSHEFRFPESASSTPGLSKASE